MTKQIEEFLKEYNTLLEEYNEEIKGIEDMQPYKKCKSIKEVDIRNIENDEILLEEYNNITNQ